MLNKLITIIISCNDLSSAHFQYICYIKLQNYFSYFNLQAFSVPNGDRKKKLLLKNNSIKWLTLIYLAYFDIHLCDCKNDAYAHWIGICVNWIRQTNHFILFFRDSMMHIQVFWGWLISSFRLMQLAEKFPIARFSLSWSTFWSVFGYHNGINVWKSPVKMSHHSCTRFYGLYVYLPYLYATMKSCWNAWRTFRWNGVKWTISEQTFQDFSREMNATW